MARVLDSVVGRIKPGRMDDHLGMAIEVIKLFERLGAESPRLAMAVATGEPAGTFTFSTEYPSAEAWGEVGDTINNDAEFQAFITRVSSPNAPSDILQFSTAQEVPLGRNNNPALGNVIAVHVGRPIPGKLEQGLEQARRVCDLVEARGASNARLWGLGYAGLGSGLQMLSFEFPDLKTCGRVGDMWMIDPEMVELATNSRYGDAVTTTPVFDGLYQVVPL